MTPSTAPPTATAAMPSNTDDSDDSALLITVSIGVLLGAMLGIFVCCCYFTRQKQQLEQKTTGFRINKQPSSIVSEGDGKVALLTLSDQRVADLQDAMKGVDSSLSGAGVI